MKIISYKQALELVKTQEVYLIYDDNTENCVNYEPDVIESMDKHNSYGGLFGIEEENNENN